jgi:adsorption protein B
MDTLHAVFLVLAYTAAIGFFVFGVDDVFFDMQFLRHLLKTRHRRPLTPAELAQEPERLVAVFIPAWNEGGVVNKMADYAARTLLYERYDIFIGVYANDAETNRCVDSLVASSGRIHKAVVPHDGPTSKADCLNWIYAAMKAAEIPGRREYEIIALHDAEDILHPLTLKVYNRHVPREYDMAQLPVLPLELPPLTHWVGNSYIDEFSELHVKDMFSRTVVGGVVPSAGVGTAFSRRAIEHLASLRGDGPFAVESLAEDYLVGLQLRRAGFRVGFIDSRVERRLPSVGGAGPRTVSERIAVRERFPTRFFAAVRQKTRWIIGTAFQGWEHGGWEGSSAVKYTLVRDRRAPVVHTVNAAGYCVVAYMLAEFGVRHTPLSNAIFIKPLIGADTMLWNIVLADTALLLYRVGQKAACVAEVYGAKQAFFSLPRYPVSSFINMAATLWASVLYTRHRVFKSPLVWAKTAHTFPGTRELGEFHRSIEDLLVEQGYATHGEIGKLLEKNHGRSAARALLDSRRIGEDDFAEIWSRQSGLEVKAVSAGTIDREMLAVWTEGMAVENEALPLAGRNGNLCSFAFAEPPNEARLALISETVGMPVAACLARPSNLKYARDAVYPLRALQKVVCNPVADLVAALSADQRERLGRFSCQHGIRVDEALLRLRMASAERVRNMMAESFRARPSEMSNTTPSVSIAEALGGLFCEVHGLVPLHDGTIGIADPVHPAVAGRVRRILNGALQFSADTPAGHAAAFGRLAELRIPSGSLLRGLEEAGIISADNARRVANMSGFVQGPVDRLLIQLGLSTRQQVSKVLRASSGLEVAGFDDSPSAPDGGGVLAPGFAERTGIRIHDVGPAGVTLRISSLPAADDLAEVRRRCAGVPLHFEFSAS